MSYFETRYCYNRKKNEYWKILSSWLQNKYFSDKKTVIDLGCGYCYFINNIIAEKRYALDRFEDIEKYVDKEVCVLKGDIRNSIHKIEDNSVDIIFASNFFEHLELDDIIELIQVIYKKLKLGAEMILIQPNYRLCCKNYFDDYTHKTVFTAGSMQDLLCSYGFKIKDAVPAFLPLAAKDYSIFPAYLLNVYLRLPFKPFARQFLIVAEK